MSIFSESSLICYEMLVSEKNSRNPESFGKLSENSRKSFGMILKVSENSRGNTVPKLNSFGKDRESFEEIDSEALISRKHLGNISGKF